jgi:DNA-binding Xre family transcriptional regulator
MENDFKRKKRDTELTKRMVVITKAQLQWLNDNGINFSAVARDTIEKLRRGGA